MVDDALDFIVFLMLLGICLSTAFGVVLPVVYNYSHVGLELREDKSAPKIEGYTNVTNFDGTYTKEDIALMLQVQDLDLPEPKVIEINGTKVDINASYIPDKVMYGKIIADNLDSDKKYEFILDYGDESTPRDDFYKIIEK